MSLLIANRTVQDILVAEFVFNYNDTMVNTAGNTVDFGASNLGGAAGAFDIISLPNNAIVVGGQIITHTTFDTAGYDVILGDSAVTDRYHATADLKTAGRVALTPTGFVSTGGKIRLTFSSDDVCTAGKMAIQVHYIVRGRAKEVVYY